MPNRNPISHNIELSSKEKKLCNASTGEVILHYIINYPGIVIGSICGFLFLIRSYK
jgi:hypothetical protein